MSEAKAFHIAFIYEQHEGFLFGGDVGLTQKRQKTSDELQFVVFGNPRLMSETRRQTEVRRTFA